MDSQKQTIFMMATFCLKVSMAQVLLPQNHINGEPIPSSIFEGNPYTFDAFVVSIIFSFTGAFSLLKIRNKPQFVILRRCYFIISMVSTTVALSVLASTLMLQNCFRQVLLGIKLWQYEDGSQY